MLKFLQDYTTKAIPPEVFKVDQEVERSPESELYFVRLGVAGFLVDGVVLNEDYQPIVRPSVAIVAAPDRRFADTGRGGEVIGLDTPARASSGPGNAAVFAGQPDSVGLTHVEAEQLRADLAAAVASNSASEARHLALSGDVTALQASLSKAESARNDLTGEVEGLRAELATARQNAETALADVDALRSENAGLSAQLGDAMAAVETAQATISDLEKAAQQNPPQADKPAAKTKATA